jgi:hypothetical protein
MLSRRDVRDGIAETCGRSDSGLQASSSALHFATCAGEGTYRWLIRRNVLAASPNFSLLPDVRRPSDGPGVDLARRFLAWCELGGDLLAARVLPASPRGGAQGIQSSLAPRPSGWQPSRRAARRSPPPRPTSSPKRCRVRAEPRDACTSKGSSVGWHAHRGDKSLRLTGAGGPVIGSRELSAVCAGVVSGGSVVLFVAVGTAVRWAVGLAEEGLCARDRGGPDGRFFTNAHALS